nr:F-box/kelch-repeat protein At3g23880-like [Ipomoea batatas]
MSMLSRASNRQKVSRLPRSPLSHLPQDLIFSGVLPKLPVKPLMRFQCVSKGWLAMISSPDFAKSHLDTHKNDEEDKLATSGGWEKTPHGFSAGIVNPNGVHLNGTLNWSSSIMVGRDDWEFKIVSFNLTTNSADILSAPNPERSRDISICNRVFKAILFRETLAPPPCLSDDEDDVV